jgi:hypothetical protein
MFRISRACSEKLTVPQKLWRSRSVSFLVVELVGVGQAGLQYSTASTGQNCKLKPTAHCKYGRSYSNTLIYTFADSTNRLGLFRFFGLFHAFFPNFVLHYKPNHEPSISQKRLP